MKKLIDLQQKLSKAIDDIMDNFDWDRIHKIMITLNWKWANENFEAKVPTIAEMKTFAQSLLEEVVVNALTTGIDNYVSSGGFQASVRFLEEDERKFPLIKLEFIAEEWDYEI